MRNYMHEGVPAMSVICDGGWSKRVDVLTCEEGKKPLHIGIRNEQYVILSAATNENIDPTKHDCYRNWSITSLCM
ncbi:hypothetical protein MAR_022098 [Mya arenaria]|uniref:Uncharacterized protein n=1 Tax=Mya arenaria TaxID=6604 RepID=A0ABY7DM08_MYAAR|nr:hypothetical protein MAR_022098 [Mya arenaria]